MNKFTVEDLPVLSVLGGGRDRFMAYLKAGYKVTYKELNGQKILLASNKDNKKVYRERFSHAGESLSQEHLLR